MGIVNFVSGRCVEGQPPLGTYDMGAASAGELADIPQAGWATAYTLATGDADVVGLRFNPTARCLSTGKGNVYVTRPGKADTTLVAPQARVQVNPAEAATAEAARIAAKAARVLAQEQARQAQAAAQAEAAAQAARDAQVLALFTFGFDGDGLPFTSMQAALAHIDARKDMLRLRVAALQEELDFADALVADAQATLAQEQARRDTLAATLASVAAQAR